MYTIHFIGAGRQPLIDLLKTKSASKADSLLTELKRVDELTVGHDGNSVSHTVVSNALGSLLALFHSTPLNCEIRPSTQLARWLRFNDNETCAYDNHKE